MAGGRTRSNADACSDVAKMNQGDSDRDDPNSPVSASILAAITSAINDVIGERLDNIDSALNQLVQLNQRMVDVERAMQDTSDRLEAAVSTLLPSITRHMSQLAEGLARKQLEADVHSRKWNLVIHGLDGRAGEEGEVTRQTCKDFAKTALKVDDAEATIFSACHRLSQNPNAGIIIRFVDLAQRDRWLSGTKYLKNYNKKISISPDLPPVLRPLKDELMQTRAQLPAQQKQKSRVRFIPQWPFVELQIQGQSPQGPKTDIRSVTNKMLELDSLLLLNQWKSRAYIQCSIKISFLSYLA